MKRILIIEDNENIRENTAEILELENFSVLKAKNGREGAAIAISHKPDLIICDIKMPEMDGYEVLQLMQRDPVLKTVPFIIVTAKTEKADYKKAYRLGAQEYIIKPFEGKALLAAIRRQLDTAVVANKRKGISTLQIINSDN